jgi:hypothetical protein
MGKKNQTDSLCWLCGNACGGCSWSESLTPVEGWTATKEKLYGGLESYNVIACPLFWKPEEGCGLRWQDLDDKGCELLVSRLLEISREDYIYGRETTQKEIERFLRGRGASRLHMISNPEAVIRHLKKEAFEWKKRTAMRKMV